MLVSSRNSRRAASSRSSPASTMPLGIVHAPESRSLQNGPPGCAMKTSRRPRDLRKSKRPALTLGRLDRGIAKGRWIGWEHRTAHPPLPRRRSRGKIATNSHAQASPTMLNRFLTTGTLTCVLAMTTPVAAQESVDRAMIGRLQAESQAHSQVLETYRTLTDVIGPRLTGSPGFKRAVDWTRDHLKEWGMSNVTVESFPFG